MKTTMITTLIALTLTSVSAQAREPGYVFNNCKTEIEKFCADKEHGHGEVRACLEAKKSEVSEACKKALDETGPGKGRGKNRRK